MIIDRYISREILRPCAAGLGLLVLVYVGYSAARQLSLAATGQLDMLTAFKLVGLNTLITLEVLLPSALFFSVLAAVGRLHRDAEMNALHAAGISRMRILQSVFKLSVLVAVVAGAISIEGRPWAYRESYRLEAEAAARFDLKKMATGEFITLEGSEFTFIAEDIDLERGLHKGVFLQRDHRDRQHSEIIAAESAALPTLNPGEALTAQFHNGHHYLLDNREGRDISSQFRRLTVHLENQETVERYRRKAETTARLASSSRAEDIAEYQWRTILPLLTILLALAAVPLAKSNPREPRFRSFLAAIGLYIALLSLVSVMRTWIEQGVVPQWPGLWIPCIVMSALLALLVNPPGRRP